MAAAAQAASATQLERFAWSMYDFANSGYTTVVLTTIFNAYFVAVVAGPGMSAAAATLLWTMAIAAGNLIVLVTAPVIGGIADHHAWKKRFLLVSTVGCIASTALLGLVGEGAVAAGTVLVILSFVMFASGENLIAAFLPEIVSDRRMGRLSGYGWSLGYIGGLLTLACCLLYINWAQDRGHDSADFVPVTLWITAGIFALAASPAIVLLRERGTPVRLSPATSYFVDGFVQVRDTLHHAKRFQDLFRFLATLVVFQAGVSTVVVVAAIYAQEVLAFSSDELVFMIMIVNVTAAAGAFAIGHLQDRVGSLRALALALSIWIIAIVWIYVADSRRDVWLAANMIGFAMGSSQSAGRALVGHFAPVAQAGEIFGLWGLAARTAAIVGPATYGIVNWLNPGDQRMALLTTVGFFVVGLVLLATVDEERGRRAALADDGEPSP